MAALVQSFPSPAPTLTMLQTRSSSSEAFPSGSQNQQHQRNSQMPRNIYNTAVGGMTVGNYRGAHSTIATVAPYAFTSTPVLPNTANPLRQHPTAPILRQENRTLSAPTVPFPQQTHSPDPTNSNRHRPQKDLLMNTSLGSSNMVASTPQSGSKDDASITNSTKKHNAQRPLSSIELNTPSLSIPASHANAVKPSPDRYRRNNRRPENAGLPTATIAPLSTQGGSALPSGSGMATVGHLYNNNSLQSMSTPSLTSYPAFRETQVPSQFAYDVVSPSSRVSSADDMSIPRQAMVEQAKRYRRRSISSLEVKDHVGQPSVTALQPPAPSRAYVDKSAHSPSPEREETQAPPQMQRPASSHGRNNSNGSTSSSRSLSRPTSVCQNLSIRLLYASD